MIDKENKPPVDKKEPTESEAPKPEINNMDDLANVLKGMLSVPPPDKGKYKKKP